MENGSLVINIDCEGYYGTLNMPDRIYIFMDGQKQSLGEWTEFTNGKVIWNFVHADNVEIHTHEMLGMVVALGATVKAGQNLNGTVIAENIYIEGETHRTDFTGTVTPDNLKLQFFKKIDNENPEINQQFTFLLEQWMPDTSKENGGEWTELQRQTNQRQDINFADLTYTEKDTGTYWYRIREESKDGYDCDKAQYFVKVEVNLKADGTNKKVVVSYTYYRSDTPITGDPAMNESEFTKVTEKSDRVFHNTTDDGAHTLPSTGGPGEWTIPSIGILLMAGSLLVVTKQRPQRKEDR